MELLHNFAEGLDEVIFLVSKEGEGRSWELGYEIHAANLHEPVNGFLILEVQKQQKA